MTTDSPDAIDAEAIRAIERARLSALVSGDIRRADTLHAADFQLVTPIGALLSKEQYLGAVSSGQIAYHSWTPGPIDVRVHGSAAVIRYQADLDVSFGGHHVGAGRYWHTDSYELRQDGWQAVWSQATAIS